MQHRSTSPRMWLTALLLLAVSTVRGTALHAQEASAPAAVTAAPASAPTADIAPAAPTAPAGPRIAPPLERYEAPLPGARADAAPVESGSNHTIVLSTLALILVVIIVVLLAVK